MGHDFGGGDMLTCACGMTWERHQIAQRACRRQRESRTAQGEFDATILCRSGHPRTPEHGRWIRRIARPGAPPQWECAECRRIVQRDRRAQYEASDRDISGYCRAGHARTPESGHYRERTRRGGVRSVVWVCAACAREYTARYRAGLRKPGTKERPA